MKFLDSNIFLRYLVAPPTVEDRRKQEACQALFLAVARGEEQITASESILHEVLYVLCSPRQYKLTHQDAVGRLRPVLSLRGFHLPQKRLLMNAVELFSVHSFLDFADTVAIVHSQEIGDDLLSYDTGFDAVPGVQRQEP